jgi:DNA-binding beta-propeller fold protein YncE
MRLTSRAAAAVLGLASVVAFFPVASTAQGPSYELWVGNQTTDEVLVFDGRTLSLVARIPVDSDDRPATSGPHLITFTPDNRLALVANVVAGANRNNIVVIDAVSRRIVGTVPAGPAAHQAKPSPDGRRFWVVNVAAHDLMEVEIQGTSFSSRRRISSGGIRPITVVFTRDGRKAYLTNGGSPTAPGSIVVLDTTSGSVLKKWDDLGREAVYTGLSEDGRRIYANVGFHAANPAAKNDIFFVFDPATDTIVHQAQLPHQDLHIFAEAPGRNELWITARFANQIVVVETRSGRYQVVAVISTADKPDGIAFAPDGSRAFVAHRGTAVTGDIHTLTGRQQGFSVIDVASRRVLGHIPLDGDIHGLAVRRN